MRWTPFALVALIGCGGAPELEPDPLPQPLVERASECIWGDALRNFHRGPSPVASERPRACERNANGARWLGCVHLDLTRVACLDGCSECLAYVIGTDERPPVAERFDRCWPDPEPGASGPPAGCAVAFILEGSSYSAGQPFPAPTYDCAMIDGVCSEVPWPAADAHDGSHDDPR